MSGHDGNRLLKSWRRFREGGSRIPPFMTLVVAITAALVFLVSTQDISFLVGTEKVDSMPKYFELITTTADFAQAYADSGGFFDDIRANDWALLKRRIASTPDCLRNCGPEEPPRWYQNNWEPNFTCLHERRLGLWGDGGKWACDPHRITTRVKERGCLVYSVGSNNDFSFEEAILRDVSPECEIHTFDHTIGAKPSKLPVNVTFHPWGLARKNEGQNMKTMASIIRTLGHTDREIDIFKIDCEGCEWETVKSWFKGGARIRQVLVEVHSGTNDAIVPLPAMDFMSFMKEQGYVIFHKEPNIAFTGGYCIEYAFVLLEGLKSAAQDEEEEDTN